MFAAAAPLEHAGFALNLRSSKRSGSPPVVTVQSEGQRKERHVATPHAWEETVDARRVTETAEALKRVLTCVCEVFARC